MSSFKVKTQALRSFADEATGMREQLQNSYQSVCSHAWSISFSDGSTEAIRSRLRKAADNIWEHQKKLKKMQDKLTDAAEKYEKTEAAICSVSKDGVVSNWDRISTINWTDGMGEAAKDAAWDIFGGAGGGGAIIGGSKSILDLVLKMANGEDIAFEDIGGAVQGGLDIAENFGDAYEAIASKNWKELFGLTPYKNPILEPGANWRKVFWDEIRGIDGTEPGPAKISGWTKAGWLITAATTIASNVEEYNKGGMTFGRAVEESVLETGIEIAKGAAIATAVAMGAAALGVSAPAVVVAGAGVVVSAGLDFVCKKLTKEFVGEEKGLTETVSDALLDTGVGRGIESAINGAASFVGGAWSSATNAICGWGRSLGFA